MAYRISSTRLKVPITTAEFVETVHRHGTRLGMNGKGCSLDKMFIERFSRSSKHKDVCLRAYDILPETRRSNARKLDFYNGHGPHATNDDLTSDGACLQGLTTKQTVRSLHPGLDRLSKRQKLSDQKGLCLSFQSPRLFSFYREHVHVLIHGSVAWKQDTAGTQASQNLLLLRVSIDRMHDVPVFGFD